MTGDIHYPRAIECIMPIVDGWTPVTAADLQIYHDVMRRIEEVLGSGPINISKTLFGPKGSNASVGARLNAFLDEDGSLHDIVFVTGTEQLSAFSETSSIPGGVFISFGGHTFSRSGHGPGSYIVMFTCKSPRLDRVPTSISEYITRSSVFTPAVWWTTEKAADGVRITGRRADGGMIDPADVSSIDFALLVFGYESYATG